MTTTAVNPIINKPRETPTRHWARSSSQNIVGADRPRKATHGYQSQAEEPTRSPRYASRRGQPAGNGQRPPRRRSRLASSRFPAHNPRNPRSHQPLDGNAPAPGTLFRPEGSHSDRCLAHRSGAPYGRRPRRSGPAARSVSHAHRQPRLHRGALALDPVTDPRKRP